MAKISTDALHAADTSLPIPEEHDLPLPERATFSTGAVRSKLEHVRFDCIPPTAIRRLAARYGFGIVVRGYPEDNWMKGIPTRNILNHIYNHLNQFELKRLGVFTPDAEPDDDDLAGAMWGIAALMHFQENGNPADEVSATQTQQKEEEDASSKTIKLLREIVDSAHEEISRLSAENLALQSSPTTTDKAYHEAIKEENRLLRQQLEDANNKISNLEAATVPLSGTDDDEIPL